MSSAPRRLLSGSDLISKQDRNKFGGLVVCLTSKVKPEPACLPGWLAVCQVTITNAVERTTLLLSE